MLEIQTNPFKKSYSNQEDLDLIKASLNGDKKSLEKLLAKHRLFIYNLTWKMVLSPMDAEDITQDLLIKLITNLGKFESRSEFRTWLYRMVVNHILNLKKRDLENIVTTFNNYFADIEKVADYTYLADEDTQMQASYEEVKISCTAGMLLCLDREQRMIFVLGDIFEMDHNLGADVFNISAENFRQKLSRSRKELYNWMNNKCSLVNTENPCKCPKKTRGFIELGYVDPKALKFNSNYTNKLSEINQRDVNLECKTIEDLHQRVFLDQPFKEMLNGQKIIDDILNNIEIKQLYNF
jgi:RNA polymerase sigma factor (sigma-70 family)